MHAAAKKRGGKKKGTLTDETASEAEDFEAATPEPQQQQRRAVDTTPFTVTGVKVVESTEGHQPPMKEETIAGRYAGVLFTGASQVGHLYRVYEDMLYLQ